MVDVTSKDITGREAVAGCSVRMMVSTRDLIMTRSLPKGDALEVARVAGIMGAKRTAELIPLCHPIALGSVEITFAARPYGLDVTASARTADRTGVEMEALMAVTVAALTIYDMVKGTERGVKVTDIRLLRKSGGRSGTWVRSDTE